MTKEDVLFFLGRFRTKRINEKLYDALGVAIEALAQPEIVRCKDCKYWDSTGYCLYGSRLAWRGNYNDYCSRAKRREG